MIEMWDKIFSKQNPAIGEALENKDGKTAFELMNKELDKVWKEVYRVLKDGGIACINIGDATRKIGDQFKLYASHSRILQYCLELGFSSLPEILWRKQTNPRQKRSLPFRTGLPSDKHVLIKRRYCLRPFLGNGNHNDRFNFNWTKQHRL
jgi:DNA modification methylase